MNTCYYCTNHYTLGCSCIQQRLCDNHSRTYLRKIRVNTSELIKGFIDIFSFLKLFKTQALEFISFWAKPYSIKLNILTQLVSKLINTSIVSSSSTILSIAFNQISKIVATLNEENEIIIWDYSKNSKLKEIKKFKILRHTNNNLHYKFSIALSTKYEYIAYSNDSTLGIWFYNKNEIEIKSLAEIGFLTNIKINDAFLAIAGQYNRIKLFSADNFEYIGEMNCGINSSFIEISECNKIYFCSRHHEKKLKVFDIIECCYTIEIDLQYNKTTCFALSQDNNYIGLAFKNKIITVYLLSDLKNFFNFELHESQIETLAFISSSSKIVSGGQDHYLIIWDLLTRSCSKKIDLKIKCIYVQTLEHNHLMILGYNNDIQTLNIDDGCAKSLLDGHLDEISSIALSKSRNFLATGGHDHSIYIWKIDDQSFVSIMNAHEGCVSCLNFCQNEELLASFGGDFFIKMWNRNTMEMTRVLKCENKITQIFVAGDDSLIVGNEDGNKITIWQLYADKIQHLYHKGKLEDVYLITKNQKYMILIQFMSFIIWKLDLAN